MLKDIRDHSRLNRSTPILSAGLSDPGPAGYASRKDFSSGQQVPVVIDGRQTGQISVDDILP